MNQLVKQHIPQKVAKRKGNKNKTKQKIPWITKET
jgi:hypothetical protein